MSCIVARSLFKSYGDIKAVNGIDLDVKSGQVFGFLGPNGAGKSTTIKLLTTLIRPTSGKLTILGVDAIRNPLSVRTRIGFVSQQPSYEPTLSVEKSIQKYGMMWDLDKKIGRERTEELLDAFDLSDIRKMKNEDLSVGQRRRVQVAREFIHDMDLLFLDEPMVGLDPTARRKFQIFLKNKIKTGLTVFFTTHVLTEAEFLCDKIAIINNGKIVTVDTPNELKKTFGREKTIKIHLSEIHEKISDLLKGINDFDIEFNSGTHITIRSNESELVLTKVLEVLSKNNLKINDLSATPTSLEDIFLKIVENSNASST